LYPIKKIEKKKRGKAHTISERLGTVKKTPAIGGGMSEGSHLKNRGPGPKENIKDGGWGGKKGKESPEKERGPRKEQLQFCGRFFEWDGKSRRQGKRDMKGGGGTLFSKPVSEKKFTKKGGKGKKSLKRDGQRGVFCWWWCFLNEKFRGGGGGGGKGEEKGGTPGKKRKGEHQKKNENVGGEK